MDKAQYFKKYSSYPSYGSAAAMECFKWFILVTLMTQLVTAEEVTISSDCSSSPPACITLSNYVAPRSSSNLTLSLEAGVHSLRSLAITNVKTFTLKGENGETTIHCIQSGRHAINSINLSLRTLRSVAISGITFVGCNLDFQQCNNTKISHSNFYNGSNGALQFSNCFNVSIDDSKYENNRDSAFGGVIEFSSTTGIKITRSDFFNNSLTSFGSVVRTSNANGVIICCNFSNNNAGSFGGIVRTQGKNLIYIINSTFTENSVSSFGGIIRLDSTDIVSVISSNFYYNIASGGFGGIVKNDHSAGLVNILASNFSHNRAKSGTIASDRSSQVIVNCAHFLNSSANPAFLRMSNSSGCTERFKKAICGIGDCEGM